MAVESVHLPWLQGKNTTRIAIIGDLILDEYLQGSVDRISPEAPVPVHLVKHTQATAGGAANTARNVALAGGHAAVFGVLGQDEAGEKLLQIMKDDGIETSSIIQSIDRPTIRKTRVTANNQQIVRIDWERTAPIEQEMRDQLMSRLQQQSYDAILLSDYGKGGLPTAFIRQIIDFAKQSGTPVIVDPKGRDFDKYRGCFLITPNRKEACEPLDIDPADDIAHGHLCHELQRKFDFQNVLVTLGSAGMMLKQGESPPKHLPSEAREVFDVSGAGDAVVAMMTLSAGAGADLETAMQLANTAAGIVVEKLGTQPIYRGELEAAFSGQKSAQSFVKTTQKIISKSTLENRAKEMRTRGRIVFTNGCFDILHEGHITYLEEARTLGDLLVIGVNTDDSISKIKGPNRPIVPLEQRMRVLAALACVDFVVPFSEETPLDLIQKIRPNTLVKGADYTVDTIVGADFVIREGGSVRTVDLVEGRSSSGIIEKISATLNP